MQIQQKFKSKLKSIQVARQWDRNSIFAICAVLKVFLDNRIRFPFRFR